MITSTKKNVELRILYNICHKSAYNLFEDIVSKIELPAMPVQGISHAGENSSPSFNRSVDVTRLSAS